MKTLKFRPYLVDEILAGTKTSTWRLFVDKDLQNGDELDFINWETKEKFGTAKITSLQVKTLGTLSEEDFSGHERYPSEEAMYEELIKYYGDKVNKDSEVKVFSFVFSPLK